MVKPIFGENTCFLNFFQEKKVNLFTKILCVIFHVKHKTLPSLAVLI